MKKNILIILIGLTVINIFAQNKLSGTITDAETNEPLIGVSIYSQNLGLGTSSDFGGNYVIDNVPSGTHKFSFEYIGFKTITKTITFNNVIIKQNIALSPSVLEMDEVIVSTPFNKIQSENVVKVAHKNIKQLLEKGGITLIDGLATIPGVSQLSSGNSIGKPVIRGLSGNRVLVYAQGVRLENQQFGNDHGLGVNEAGVGSVEIIKGPASLLYGSDALGGVIYLNPERFSDANTSSFNVEEKHFSNTEGNNLSGVFKTSSDKFNFLIRNTYDSHIDYKIPNGNRVTNSRYREYDVKTGFAYHNEKWSSTLRYNYNHFLTGIPEEIGIQSTNRNPLYPKQKVENHILSLHNKFYFKNSKLDANFGYIFNDRNEFSDNAVPNLRMLLKTLDFDVKYYLPKFKKLESIIGVQGMYQTNTNKAVEFLIPDAITNDIGIFGTSNYAWKDQALQGGLRIDTRHITTQAHLPIADIHHIGALDKNYTSVNASLGYKTNVSDHIIVRVNLASGFRVPNLAELTSNGIHEGTNRFEVGNPDLKNEQNLQADLDLSFQSEHVEFYINSFYNSIKNYIFVSPTGAQLEATDVYNYNQKDAFLYGGEIGFHLHPHPLDWFHLESSFESVTGKEKNGGYIPLIPANIIKNNVRIEFKNNHWLKNGYASFTLNQTLKQNKPSPFETISPAYTLMNFGLGGDVSLNKTKFKVAVAATNVFNTTYMPHTSFLKTLDIPEMGRNIVMSVNFRI
ncbi:MAG: TonB-dependent receptor [Flavobacteriales bacterium]|jgi:iron complex outermembrane recepter protein|nr:TonB-dependent receptor [Flavobacteriales bacterium]